MTWHARSVRCGSPGTSFSSDLRGGGLGAGRDVARQAQFDVAVHARLLQRSYVVGAEGRDVTWEDISKLHRHRDGSWSGREGERRGKRASWSGRDSGIKSTPTDISTAPHGRSKRSKRSGETKLKRVSSAVSARSLGSII